MYKDALRAAWAEINITNLDFNIKQIKEKVGSRCQDHRCGESGCLRPWIGARRNRFASQRNRILCSSHPFGSGAPAKSRIPAGGDHGSLSDPGTLYRHHHRAPTVTCSLRLQNAEAISKAAAAAGIIIKGYIPDNTGMGRIGYSDDVTSVEDVKMIAGLSNFKINGLFSHFATADAADKTYATVQEQRYMSFYKQLLKRRGSISRSGLWETVRLSWRSTRLITIWCAPALFSTVYSF